MDYKYIEQLLERYWACETSLQEEQILRTFFQQAEVPAHLMPYKAVFDLQQEQAEPTLGEDFDARMLQMVDDCQLSTVNCQPLTSWRRSLRPFYQAAGLVALILTIGMAAQRSFNGSEEPQQAQFAQADSMVENPIQEVTPLPEQQAALTVEQTDSINLTR
jgi:hypothetical protein